MDFEKCRQQAFDIQLVRCSSYYRRQAPNLFNFLCPDPNLRSWILSQIAKEQIEVPEQNLYFYRDISVYDDTSAYNAEGEMLEITSADRGAQTRLVTGTNTVVGVKGPLAFIFKSGKDNFGHILVEMLPKLELLLTLKDRPVNLLLPPLTDQLKNFFLYILDSYFPSVFNVVIPETWPVLVDTLIIPSPVTTHNFRKSEVVIDFAERVTRHSKKTQCGKALYVSRRNITNRKMVNEPEIEMIFESYGFETVHPEEMTFDEQVNMFSSASRVAGPLGAALTNILFSPPDAEIYLLDPGLYDLFYYDLASLRGQTFHWIFTEKIKPFDVARLHRGYYVEPSLVRGALSLIQKRP